MEGLSILWITNLSAPYRRPVWAALANRATLRVGLLAESEPNRRWSSELPQGVERIGLRVLAMDRADHSIYFLLGRAIPRPRPDVVILPGWENPAAWQLFIEARLRRVPCVAFYESSGMSHRFRRGPVSIARKFFFRHVDAILTVGIASSDAVLDFGADPAVVVRANNAVDVEDIRAATRRHHCSPDADRSRRFMYVGQLIDRKNVDGLIHALKDLGGRSELVVVGEGPKAMDLRALAQELGIADRVEFVGYVEPEGLGAYFAQVGTVVLPSHLEVYGLVVNEALAAGLHAVVSNRAGVHRDVAGMRGVYVSTPDAKSLSGAMERSSGEWLGPISAPEVMAWTPEAMAGAVLRAAAIPRSGRRDLWR